MVTSDNQLVSMAYTSRAVGHYDDATTFNLYKESSANNALDGITGVLIFNGEYFIQVVQGSGSAVGDLLERLRRDPRHTDIRVQGIEPIERRSFGGWDMRMLRVSRAHIEATRSLDEALGPTVTPEIRRQLLSLVESVSETV